MCASNAGHHGSGALRFLTRLGFISNGQKFKTYLQSRGTGRKLNVDYNQIIEQAHKAYAGDAIDNQFHHDVFLIEKKNMDKASRILRRAVNEIGKLESQSKNSKVVFVANQIFSVESERKKND